jgi:hypothetical protein
MKGHTLGPSETTAFRQFNKGRRGANQGHVQKTGSGDTPLGIRQIALAR